MIGFADTSLHRVGAVPIFLTQKVRSISVVPVIAHVGPLLNEIGQTLGLTRLVCAAAAGTPIADVVHVVPFAPRMRVCPHPSSRIHSWISAMTGRVAPEKSSLSQLLAPPSPRNTTLMTKSKRECRFWDCVNPVFVQSQSIFLRYIKKLMQMVFPSQSLHRVPPKTRLPR